MFSRRRRKKPRRCSGAGSSRRPPAACGAVVAGEEEVAPVAGHAVRDDSAMVIEVRTVPSRDRRPPATRARRGDGRRGLEPLYGRIDVPGRADRDAGRLRAARRRVPRRCAATRAGRSPAAASSAWTRRRARSSACTWSRRARGRGVAERCWTPWRTRRGGCGYAIARLDTGPQQPHAQATLRARRLRADRELQREPVRELLGREARCRPGEPRRIG